PVFADIERRTLGLDPAAVAAAVTDRTRAIIVVHYAGMAAEIAALSRLAEARGIVLIEDAAEAFDSPVGGRPARSLGALAALSFQQTKNIAAGEGGALIVNRADLVERAQAIRDKGTNRRAMEEGRVAFYEWVEVGGGIAPNDLTAAVVRAQLEVADFI